MTLKHASEMEGEKVSGEFFAVKPLSEYSICFGMTSIPELPLFICQMKRGEKDEWIFANKIALTPEECKALVKWVARIVCRDEEEEHKIMEADEKSWREEDARQQKQISDALDNIKTKFGDALYNRLVEYIKDCGYVHSFEIVTKPEGKIQQEFDDGPMSHIYIQQWEVGDSGDDFHGIIVVPLPDNTFLKFCY